jgi:predicted dehydrogenase
MINFGIAGIGFMGMIHYQAAQRVRGAKVRAICTRDPKKLAGDWRSIKGNFGPPGEQMDLKGVGAYDSLDTLLADPAIDVVDLCLPPDLHADAAVKAFKAGKHVFCEKPIAVAPADADRMVKAARTADKQLLIGHVLPFFAEYEFARRAVERGKFGRLWGGHFKRIISDPLWLADFWDGKKTGGPLVDLHIHDAHFIRLVFGQPKAVFSRGRLRGDVVQYATTQFVFDDPQLAVSSATGALDQQGRAFTHGFELYFEKATLLYDFAVVDGQPTACMPLTVLHKNGKVERPALPEGDHLTAFAAEIGEVLKSIRSGNPSPVLDGGLARDALLLCQRQAASLAQGKPVKV